LEHLVAFVPDREQFLRTGLEHPVSDSNAKFRISKEFPARRKNPTAKAGTGHQSAQRWMVRGDSMPSVFALWVGQPVVLQVAADSFCVPLRGMIVGESESSVLFRVEEGREEIGIEKIMILAIEQDHAVSVLVN
jgi:hypothetical protein